MELFAGILSLNNDEKSHIDSSTPAIAFVYKPLKNGLYEKLKKHRERRDVEERDSHMKNKQRAEDFIDRMKIDKEAREQKVEEHRRLYETQLKDQRHRALYGELHPLSEEFVDRSMEDFQRRQEEKALAQPNATNRARHVLKDGKPGPICQQFLDRMHDDIVKRKDR
eukprot:gnl/MRDRNA2_/MRDRNA2_99663_c0_seq1.p1 gnl/MRDRNA2_/MRDRNA2_99663_c0~~gnl/MRDRNA2_/MRDRNA2_99663_c0_seq1.p1  ORF type:complete len:167 (-),score=46.95 gnl/MRDRNA2_/MRDRNA2_99663_c0_seq1:186-686(-)